MTNNQSSVCVGLPKGWWWILTLLGLCLLYYFMLSARQVPIETDLKDRAISRLSEEGISWAKVNLDQRGRDVLLTGIAPTDSSRDKAIAITEQVAGVRIVDFQGDVGPKEVMRSLTSARLSMEQSGDSVILSGLLPSQNAVNYIVDDARKIYGDNNVTNNLLVSNQVKEASWLSSVAELLPGLVGFENVQFNIIDAESSLSAEVVTDEEKSNLLNKITVLFGDTSRADVTVVSPLVVEQSTIVKTTPEAVIAQEDSAAEVCQAKLDTTMQGNKILFAFNAATVRTDSYPLLNQLINVLIECKQVVRQKGLIISGHTDSTGHSSYNMSLSRARANAVKHYLIRAGVDSRLVRSVGFGETQPVASNATREGRVQNRRITFILQNDSMEQR